MTVRVRKVNDNGVEWTINHCTKPEIFRKGGNEMQVKDRLVQAFGNLPLPVSRDNKYTVATQLHAGAVLSNSKEKEKAIILSFSDTLDPVLRAEQFALFPRIVKAFNDTFLPGCLYQAYSHDDRCHPHCHNNISNWSPVWHRSSNWTPYQIAYMNSMRWLPEDLKQIVGPGAYLLKERTKRVYPSLRRKELAAAILLHPEAGIAKLEKYMTEGKGKAKMEYPGVIYKGTKVTLYDLNSDLRKLGGTIALDRGYKNTPMPKDPKVSPITQQTKLDLACGILKLSKEDFDVYCDLFDPYLLVSTADEKAAVDEYRKTGRVTSKIHFFALTRLTRTAIARRLMGHTAPKGFEPSWVYQKEDSWTRFMVSALRPIVREMGFALCKSNRLTPWGISLVGLEYALEQIWCRPAPPDIE